MKVEEGAWFVRSNGGHGSYPVTREGWYVVLGYLGGVGALAVMTYMLIHSGNGPYWMWIAIFALGMAVLAYGFIQTARHHTDFTVTYDEYRKRNS
jgi:hypothetical protein